MWKQFAGACLALFLITTASAQLQSPDQFLGYKLGSRFTPHHKVEAYFRHVAAQVPSMVKLAGYGETVEGRNLLVAYVSAAAHIARLEAIRANNIAIAENRGNAAAPPIVWLSYNVHGNEASSTETSMIALYTLVNPAHAASKTWLQNTVVVIDPCLNPDGRDRYVNWFHSVAGKQYNPAMLSREHAEPWPGGRVNHYYFDLNRDWAWQSQVETRQRMQLYQSWLPQIHVDFHEQGVNQPYYFAPAAEPYHEVITPWQRSFQSTIGKNHARYFDAAGWLYFTREIFDLFYPSYGDTYPLYNGAIGMTYEQGGGPRGGLGALTDDGDTLTLTDRIEHHLATTLSTIETASVNAGKLVSEFAGYFREANTTGFGQYKSYIVQRTPSSAERIELLLDLLDRNGIKYSLAKPGNVKGYHYDAARDQSFTVRNGDILVPAQQVKSALVKVLFEPNPKLADSATYDITAWALPYVYGLTAVATTEKWPAAGGTVRAPATKNTAGDSYGYLARWTGTKAVQFATKLMAQGIRLRYSEKPFDAAGQQFDRGTMIILKTGNQYRPDLWNKVVALANETGVPLVPVTSGMVERGFDFGSMYVHPLTAPKVLLLSGEGTSPNAVGEVWHYFDEVLQYPVTLVNTNDFEQADLSGYNVIIMPNGNYRFLHNKAAADALQSWIAKGGKLIALENAVAQLAKLDWALKQKKDEDTSNSKGNNYEYLRRFENRERDELPQVTPGSIYKVELDNTHPLAFGYPSTYYTLKQDDRLYEFIKEGGWNVGVIKKQRQLAGFVGARLQNKLQDGLLFGVQDIGRGSVVYFADDVLFRQFWEGGRLLFANAVFLVGQ